MYQYRYLYTHGISGLDASSAWEHHSRCTWQWRSSELRDVLGSHSQVSLEIHLEPEIEWTQRWSWRLFRCELEDVVGGCDQVSLEMYMEAIMVRTWRPWLFESGDARGDYFHANITAMIDQMWRLTCRLTLCERWIGLEGSDHLKLKV